MEINANMVTEIAFHLYEKKTPTSPKSKGGHTTDLKRRLSGYRTGDKDAYFSSNQKITFDPDIFIQHPKGIVLKATGMQPERLIIDLMKLRGVIDTSDVEEFTVIPGKNSTEEWNETINVAIKNKWDVDACRNEILSGKPSYSRYLWQAWTNAVWKDRCKQFPFNEIWPELNPPRYGKTIAQWDKFLSGIWKVGLLLQYNLAPINSFQTEHERFSNISNNSDFYDTTLPGFNVASIKLNHKKLMIGISLNGSSERKILKDFIKWITDNFESGEVIIFIDEVDWGSLTDESKKKLIAFQKAVSGTHTVMFSGTGEEKIYKRLEDELDPILRYYMPSLSYEDLLLMRDGKHKIQDQTYLNSLDPIKNKNEITVLKQWRACPEMFRSPSGLTAPVYAQFSLEHGASEKILKSMGLAGLELQEAMSHVKLHKEPERFQSVLIDLQKRFLDVGIVSGSNISHTRVTGGRHLRVMMYWIAGARVGQITKLAEIYNGDPDLGKAYLFVPVHRKFTTNKMAESFAKAKLKEVRDSGDNRGVIFMCKYMGQRSFSISEVEAVVFFQDESSEDSSNQKKSRAFTPGLLYGQWIIENGKKKWIDGQMKTHGYIFHLSFNPDSKIVDNIINSLISEGTEGGIPVKIAASRLFETIVYWRVAGIKLEQVRGFTDIEARDFLSRIDRIGRRSDCEKIIRELGITEDSFTNEEFLALIELSKNALPVSTRSKIDVMKKLVKEAKVDDSKKEKQNGDKKMENMDEIKKILRRDCIIALRRLLYDSGMNLAGIFASCHKMSIADIGRNQTPYSEILDFIDNNPDALKLFSNHFKVSASTFTFFKKASSVIANDLGTRLHYIIPLSKG